MDRDRGSRTAVFVCQGRAVADGRLAVGRFADPVASQLLRPEERVAVEQARSGVPPAHWRERLAIESLVRCAEVVVPRTVAIDDAIREAGHEQVVIVGAGLDSRPWRLAALREAAVFAVDHPASQAEARKRSASLTPMVRRLEFVGLDLASNLLDRALGQTSHDRSLPTTWVWEGVVAYLTGPQVETTLAALAGRSAPGSLLVVNYQTPSRVSSLGRRFAGVAARVARLSNPWADEPWRSTWTAARIGELLARHGFTVRRDEHLLAIAERLGSPAERQLSLSTGRVALATFGVRPDEYSGS
jgi:methyltransferase (TIGR00027 family)